MFHHWKELEKRAWKITASFAVCINIVCIMYALIFLSCFINLHPDFYFMTFTNTCTTIVLNKQGNCIQQNIVLYNISMEKVFPWCTLEIHSTTYREKKIEESRPTKKGLNRHCIISFTTTVGRKRELDTWSWELDKPLANDCSKTSTNPRARTSESNSYWNYFNKNIITPHHK